MDRSQREVSIMLNEGKEEIAKANLLELYCMSSLESMIDRVCLEAVKDPKNEALLNERGLPNGKTGWCFVCRRAANQYCKDTRIPICS